MASSNRLSVSHHWDRSLPGNQTTPSIHLGEAKRYLIQIFKGGFFLLKRAGSVDRKACHCSASLAVLVMRLPSRQNPSGHPIMGIPTDGKQFHFPIGESALRGCEEQSARLFRFGVDKVIVAPGGIVSIYVCQTLCQIQLRRR